MRAYGMSEQKLREQLLQWLDLSLDKKVPPSLLLLSRALMVPDTVSMTDKLKATMSSLPDTVITKTKGAIREKEGKLDYATNIELIKIEEKKIEEEREEEQTIRNQEEDFGKKHRLFQFQKESDEITTKDVKFIEKALESVGQVSSALINPVINFVEHAFYLNLSFLGQHMKSDRQYIYLYLIFTSKLAESFFYISSKKATLGHHRLAQSGMVTQGEGVRQNRSTLALVARCPIEVCAKIIYRSEVAELLYCYAGPSEACAKIGYRSDWVIFCEGASQVTSDVWFSMSILKWILK